jgi:hypothetical protein
MRRFKLEKHDKVFLLYWGLCLFLTDYQHMTALSWTRFGVLAIALLMMMVKVAMTQDRNESRL